MYWFAGEKHTAKASREPKQRLRRHHLGLQILSYLRFDMHQLTWRTAGNIIYLPKIYMMTTFVL